MKNVPQIVQNRINAINMYKSDYIMIFFTPITSVTNTPKNIYLGGTIWDGFTSKYYNENNDSFGLLFQKFIASAVDKIYHPPTLI